MNKRFRLIKSKIATILVVLMCINSFAAVVGDNDGAAFITKAEFESLKNDFQTQINRYNTSLDSKIDGAIATYLSGVSIAATKNVDPLISNYDKIRWMHGPYMYYTIRKWTGVPVLTDSGDTGSWTYTDDASWHILDHENRRQSGGDQQFWFFDSPTARTGRWTITARLYRMEYSPRGWGYGFHIDYAPNWAAGSYLNRQGPTVFLECKENNGEWVIPDDVTPIMGEVGLRDTYHVTPHQADSAGTWYGWDPRTGTLNHQLINGGADIPWSDLSASGDEGDILYYMINNVQYLIRSTGAIAGSFNLASRITKLNNPQLFQTCSTRELYIYNNSGGTVFPLRTGNYFGWDQRTSAALPENGNWACRTQADAQWPTDIRWRTKKQYDCDNENLQYALFGTDVTSTMNVAPPVKTLNDFTYLDLSKSPNYVNIKVQPRNTEIKGSTPYANTFYDNTGYGSFEYHDFNTYGESSDTFNFSIPLFYRATWSELHQESLVNKADKSYLGLCDGLPILIDSTDNGTLKLSFKYSEAKNVDTSVVTLTTDDKIKTYFKNKKFTDKTGTYYIGYKNTTASGTAVSLNGTEWTDKKVTMSMEVKKGEDVWMRLDPLTENGIYCTMSDYSCTFITD